MIFLPTIKLRTSVILLLVSTVLVTLTIVGSGILIVMVARIGDQNEAQVRAAATDAAGRVEVFLKNLEARVQLAGAAYLALPTEALADILERAREPMLSAIYVIGPDGRLVVASIADASEARTRELSGIDLSAYPFFNVARDQTGVLWSDKHLSAVTGAVTLGMAASIGDGRGVIIAELPVTTLFDISRVTRGPGNLDYWIVDSKGEVVADTNPEASERFNLYSLPIVSSGFGGTAQPHDMTFGGTAYHVAASYSPALGWLFVSRIPAGLDNPSVRQIAVVILVTVVGSVLVGLMLAPLWALGIVRPLRSVAERAHQIANGEQPTEWPRGGIAEFDKLSADLGIMAGAIHSREQDLRRLNEELEDRVAHRTEQLKRSNIELSGALTTLKQAESELIRSEKLAALGRLVAGVAHELNTPLGNGRMAITTLMERVPRFEQSMAEGLRRSDLDSFLKSVRTSTLIAESNLKRATELIGSFKQVAADRTASRQRRFQLAEVVEEVLITLSPSMQDREIDVRVDVPDTLWLDSYPGDLGQVLTNLVENAVKHGLPDERVGAISIIAKPSGPDRIIIVLSDDGVGMTEDVARHAFDPFYTTTAGRDGTGLGLFITHNSVTNVLGGSIRLDTQPGAGSRFTLSIPTSAPKAADEPEAIAAPPSAG